MVKLLVLLASMNLWFMGFRKILKPAATDDIRFGLLLVRTDVYAHMSQKMGLCTPTPAYFVSTCPRWIASPCS